ncbi:MAG TPA: tRNA (adenosine(37)-N6)-threonylcarbamoyltransferase complex dimerization subunit type 1 TsaB [Flavobacteriaceae bacterium]|nr:tRNA (adenosine(37)-N6)-threonylcarbamoyltransferase complex dimerization subunit type 1 TsaB [Flavobacteriaceae bacterium]
MAYILNIETATKNCSVSVAKNGETIALKEVNDLNYSHAEKLHPFIEEVIAKANIDFKSLDAVAVSKGPGSYTGLRIGVSAAKGLCYALNLPLISLSTLNSLATAVEINKGYKIAMLDARRMEVYAAIFDSENNIVENVKAIIIDENSFKKYLENNQVYLIGDGAVKCQEKISHKNAIFKPNVLPSASTMSKLAIKKYSDKNFEDVAYFEPFYLKEFIALKSKR